MVSLRPSVINWEAKLHVSILCNVSQLSFALLLCSVDRLVTIIVNGSECAHTAKRLQVGFSVFSWYSMYSMSLFICHMHVFGLSVSVSLLFFICLLMAL